MGDPVRQKILIVDDVPGNIKVLGEALQRDHDIFIATSGKKALEIVSKESFDLVLLDVKMPGMDGFEVCRRLKEDDRSKDIPVIFITVKDQSEDELRGLELGAMDYITKPFCLPIAKTRVDTHLSLKRKTDLLEEAKETAEAYTKAKSEFLATMSHEIRTPMNAIVSMSRFALETASATERREYLETIRDSSEHLLMIINDTLDISKIEAGGMDLTHVDFDLHESLHSVVRTLDVQAKAKGLFLRLEIGPEFPRYVKSDPGRLRQVLVNLVGNALKFTGKGGVTISAWLDGDSAPPREAGEWLLCFSVADTGIGVPEEMQGFIFERFRQADGEATGSHGGTGLGLAISKHIVEMMGGQLELASQPDKGSVFTFRIPMEPGDPAVVRRGKKEWVRVPSVGASPLHILLAEDNAINVKVMMVSLSRLGHNLVVAASGKQALLLLADQHFDLVLMDVEMPGMNGLEAAECIRDGEAGEENRDIPIVAMTAYATSEVREKCFEAGMNDYISKPMDLRELSAILGRNMARVPFSTSQAAKEETMNDVLDRDAALARLGGDEEMYNEIVASFLDGVSQRLTTLRKAVANSDWKTARLLSHTLKSNAATVGAIAGSEAASDMENAVREKDEKRFAEAFQHVELEMEKVKNFILR